MVWPSTVDSILNKKLRSLINKGGTQIKTKHNISSFRPNLDSNQTKFICDENLLPVQSTINHMKLGKLILQVFRTLTLILSWKRGKLSKTLSGNVMWICGRNTSLFRFNMPLNLEQVCDNITYVSDEYLEDFTTSNNIV